MMKDWDCMTDLLLDEPQKGEERKFFTCIWFISVYGGNNVFLFNVVFVMDDSQ